jgi:hypothetical protein
VESSVVVADDAVVASAELIVLVPSVVPSDASVAESVSSSWARGTCKHASSTTRPSPTQAQRTAVERHLVTIPG